jgi:O-antigen/teichoic acid export membrane protein
MTSPTAPATSELRAEKRTLTRRSAFNFAGLGVSSLTQFLLVVVLAHALPQRGAGVFFEGFAAVRLLAAVATLGLDVSAVRYVAMYHAKNDPTAAAAATRYSARVAALTSVALTAGTILVAPAAARAFEAPGLTDVLQIMAASLPFVVLESVLIGATRGTGAMAGYVWVDQVLDGTLRLALVWAALAVTASAAWAATASSLTSVVTCAAAMFMARRLITGQRRSSTIDRLALLRFAAFQWGTVLAGTGTLWADTLLLGLWRAPQEVAAYSVATRTVALGLAFVLPIGIAFQPVIGRLHTVGDIPRLARMYAFATRLSTMLGCPPLVLVAVLSTPILTLLYGQSYAAAAAPLAILAIAQTANAATGPSGYIITMIGRTDITFRINVITVVLNVAANVALIPAYGMVGAGIAWAAAVIVSNGLRLIEVWRQLHVQPFDGSTAKTLLVVAGSGIVATAVALATHRFGALTEVVVVGVAAGLVMIVGLGIGGLLPRRPASVLAALADSQGGRG